MKRNKKIFGVNCTNQDSNYLQSIYKPFKRALICSRGFKMCFFHYRYVVTKLMFFAEIGKKSFGSVYLRDEGRFVCLVCIACLCSLFAYIMMIVHTGWFNHSRKALHNNTLCFLKLFQGSLTNIFNLKYILHIFHKSFTYTMTAYVGVFEEITAPCLPAN